MKRNQMLRQLFRCRHGAVCAVLTAVALAPWPAQSEQTFSSLRDVLELARSNSERIIGGEDAAPDEFPWMVALLDANTDNARDAQFCGGSLIRPGWVLTAAHCVEGEQSEGVDVLLGRVDLEGNGGERIDVSRIVVHPDYDDASVYPDLALLELSEDSAQTPVGLVTPGSGLDSAGTVATTTGWGVTDVDTGDTATILQKVDVPVVTHAACAEAYGDGDEGVVEEAMICAGLPEGGKDSCQGDSGGPLFVSGGQDGQWVQSGITSWGNGCALPDFPGVYARISTYTDWIASVTGDDPMPPGPGPGPDGPFEPAFSFECSGLQCSFDASETTADANIDFYIWSFGDHGWAFGQQVDHLYAEAGDYTVTLFVLLDDGRIANIGDLVSVDGSDNNAAFEHDGTVEAVDDVISVPEGGFEIEQAGTLNGRLRGPEGTDLDLHLIKLSEDGGDGVTVASAVSLTSWEKVSYAADPGVYKWVVHAYAGTGDFKLTSSFGATGN